jgi:hypothetical protein
MSRMNVQNMNRKHGILRPRWPGLEFLPNSYYVLISDSTFHRNETSHHDEASHHDGMSQTIFTKSFLPSVQPV